MRESMVVGKVDGCVVTNHIDGGSQGFGGRNRRVI
jgi:hypothetical protein